MQENTPNYYSVIPADVRYSDISANAKLLYGEITALCSNGGYCWASNSYFAKIYKAHINTVSRWVNELAEAGFVDIVNQKSSGNQRHIYLSPKMVRPITKNGETPITKNGEHNNTRYNNKTNNKKNTKKKTKMTLGEWEKKNGTLCIQMMHRWVKDKNFNQENIISLIERFRTRMVANGNEYANFVAAFQTWINEGYLGVKPEQLIMIKPEDALQIKFDDKGVRL